MDRVECIFDGKHELGEGPVWNREDDRLWWTDIRGPALHAIDPSSGAHASWRMSAPLGSFAFCGGCRLLLALKTRLELFDPAKEDFRPLVDLEPDLPGNRLNDGKCDRQGRFWVGTMQDGEKEPAGTLYRFDADCKATAVRRGITIPNSLAFSPDGQRMYFADTMDGRILCFDYDPVSGSPRDEREFAPLDAAPGRPDGSTVDSEGCLWNARYGGSCVVRFTPEGKVDRIVELPATQVTSCAFGGPGLDVLFITTATQFMSRKQREAEPLAGGLFAIRPGVTGVPETPFAG
jgi:sugar lactone lactonase YvrE